MVTLIRPPLRVTNLDSVDVDHRFQRESQAQGARYRSIVDAEFLALPGAVNAVREDREAGEEFRFLSSIPFKMLLFDRKIAVVPLDLGRPESPSLVVRSSALLDALRALFEILWKKSESISFSSAGFMKTVEQGPELSKREVEIVLLMAAGLNDKSIACELNVSSSTLNRDIAEIMKLLGARTRFQLGRFTTHYEN